MTTGTNLLNPPLSAKHQQRGTVYSSSIDPPNRAPTTSQSGQYDVETDESFV